ncbi:MAG: hypothetical protein WDN28_17065 [Chthoniobacter sp.]
MKPFSTLIRLAVLMAFAPATMNAAEAPLALSAALAGKRLAVEAHGNGRDQLSLTLRNASSSALTVTIPAGLIAEGREKPDRVIVLRQAEASIPPQSAVDVALPVAALSSQSGTTTQVFNVTPASEPRLAGAPRLPGQSTRCPARHRPDGGVLSARKHELRAVAPVSLRSVRHRCC